MQTLQHLVIIAYILPWNSFVLSSFINSSLRNGNPDTVETREASKRNVTNSVFMVILRCLWRIQQNKAQLLCCILWQLICILRPKQSSTVCIERKHLLRLFTTIRWWFQTKWKRLDIRYHRYKHKTVSTLSCLEKFAPDDLRVVWKCEVTASVLEESFIVIVLPMIFSDDCSSETHETGPQVGYNYIQEVTKQDECIFPWLTPSLKTVTIKHPLSTGIERTKRPSFAGEILLLG